MLLVLLANLTLTTYLCGGCQYEVSATSFSFLGRFPGTVQCFHSQSIVDHTHSENSTCSWIIWFSNDSNNHLIMFFKNPTFLE